MGGRNRQAEHVGHTDRARGSDLCRHALGVGHALLADLLANGQYHTFPADHGTDTQGQGHGDDHPERCIFGGRGEVLAQLLEVGFFTLLQGRQFADLLGGVIQAEQVAAHFDAFFRR
ncbi:hypothetical protein D3C76_294380 [compost metagenome]